MILLIKIETTINNMMLIVTNRSECRNIDLFLDYEDSWLSYKILITTNSNISTNSSSHMSNNKNKQRILQWRIARVISENMNAEKAEHNFSVKILLKQGVIQWCFELNALHVQE